MATMEQGFLDGFRGSLGPVVGYQWRGRWCMRSRPATVHNPRSEAQQRHRKMFKEEVQLAGRLNWVLRQTYEQLSLEEHLTPCNHFVRVNQPAFAIEGERFTVSWEALRLSEGPVAPVAFGVPVVTEGTTLTIDFERNPLHARADNYDQVFLVVYCPENGQCFMTAPVHRRTARLSVVLPALFAGREVQLWGLVQDRQGRWSDSIYIGFGPIVDNVANDSGNTEYQEPDDMDFTGTLFDFADGNSADLAGMASVSQTTGGAPPGGSAANSSLTTTFLR
jgi:hypothetical protein